MAIQRFNIDNQLQEQFEDSMAGSNALEYALETGVAPDPLDELIMEAARQDIQMRLDRGDSEDQILAAFAQQH